jgi:hypothetical protein
MTKNQKIALGIGVTIAIYLIYTYSKEKVRKSAQKTKENQSQQTETDTLVNKFNIVPLPDIKGARYTAVTPLVPVGTTYTQPLIIATR